ncbi:hypothetical protein M3223_00825 [Paenibacillus pasadenensis]|uniref:hypothetical protein n=1 Tax=Paenibacillus pasadenensis TaxID=217090 RepID=UPI002041A348|nr:hypothetical protein [Paenibacillus pasadenensis]MCM3745887.1 hypothetical protein [Paenibacillus pasadenensis]
MGRIGLILVFYFLFFLGPFGVYAVGMVMFLIFARMSLKLLEEEYRWERRGGRGRGRWL